LKYWRRFSLVGELWQPSFMRARLGVAVAAEAAPGTVISFAAAANPAIETNLRRFITQEHIISLPEPLWYPET
jgi:hypothetical protein